MTYDSDQVYNRYKERFSSKHSFHSRLYTLMNGSKNGKHKVRLYEGQHWIKVGRSYVFTERAIQVLDGYFAGLDAEKNE